MDNSAQNSAITPTTKEHLQHEWLTIKDLQELIDLAQDTQAKYRSQGTIPFYKIGKRILYKASEIHEWLSQHKAV